MPPKKEKEKPKGWNFDFIEGAILLLFFAGILTSVVPMIIRFISSGELSFYGIPLASFRNFFVSNTQFFRALGYIFSGGAMVGAFILNKKGDAVWAEEKAKIYPEGMSTTPSSTFVEETKTPIQEKWENILRLASTENQSDWRLAIIEADIILDSLLEQLHLPGDTMGDKLKAVEKSDFTTIDLAWEAHKARNMIAHEGSNFLLNQHETRRIITLYEAVFKEFYLI